MLAHCTAAALGNLTFFVCLLYCKTQYMRPGEAPPGLMYWGGAGGGRVAKSENSFQNVHKTCSLKCNKPFKGVPSPSSFHNHYTQSNLSTTATLKTPKKCLLHTSGCSVEVYLNQNWYQNQPGRCSEVAFNTSLTVPSFPKIGKKVRLSPRIFKTLFWSGFEFMFFRKVEKGLSLKHLANATNGSSSSFLPFPRKEPPLNFFFFVFSFRK
jgi:hypothetical protein